MRRNLAVLTAAVVLAATLVPSAAFASTPAMDKDDNSDLKVVKSLGLLETPSTSSVESDLQAGGQSGHRAPEPQTAPTGTLDETVGLTVTSSEGTVTLSPADAGRGDLVTDGNALHYSADDYGVVLTGEGSAANAGYVVINDPSAPATYTFDMTVNDAPAALVESDGFVLVEDPQTGKVVNTLGRPWATDADGSAVPTWYTVDGSVLTQHVDHHGAAYPVVADPRLMCDALFCTMEYTRAETKQLASEQGFSAALITAACTALGTPLTGVLCGLSSAYVISKANEIQNSGQCVGLRRFHYAAVVPPLIVAVNCYA